VLGWRLYATLPSSSICRSMLSPSSPPVPPAP
jgi:hypothetical protein